MIENDFTKIDVDLFSISKKNAEYFIHYVNGILKPAGEEFTELLLENELKIHRAYSFNFILAHAIDHLLYSINSNNVTRTKFITDFDEHYQIEGCNHINRKFQLLDAVNNSLKHVSLDTNRYRDLITTYGTLDSMTLEEVNGKTYLKTEHYRFDYGRIVLRPIYQIFNCDLSTIDNVIEFINGKYFGHFGYGNFDYEYEPWDAIDRMIDYCSAVCMDCGESDDCECPNFVYGIEKGEFNPDIDDRFEFYDVMSQISGTREWRRKD